MKITQTQYISQKTETERAQSKDESGKFADLLQSSLKEGGAKATENEPIAKTLEQHQILSDEEAEPNTKETEIFLQYQMLAFALAESVEPVISNSSNPTKDSSVEVKDSDINLETIVCNNGISVVSEAVSADAVRPITSMNLTDLQSTRQFAESNDTDSSLSSRSTFVESQNGLSIQAAGGSIANSSSEKLPTDNAYPSTIKAMEQPSGTEMQKPAEVTHEMIEPQTESTVLPQTIETEMTDKPGLAYFDSKEKSMSTDNSDGIAAQHPLPVASSDLKMIKVSDSSSEIRQPIANQVTQNVVKNLKSGISEFSMELYPKDLGQIKVKMLSKDGLLTVELSALNPKTQTLLSANADSIRSLLQPNNEKQVIINSPAQEQANYQQNSDSQQNESGARHQRQQEQTQQKSEDEYLPDTARFISFLQQMKQTQISAV